MRNFLHCCDELMELEVDWERKRGPATSGGETWVRAYPLGIDAERLRSAAASEQVAGYEEELLRRRREHLIIRVDRADLSKNVLRGFTAFDVFLQQHPEFRERVTFIAHLQPSRQDVPEYAEYLERIEALVAVVNHRHGTTDWMPIDLRIYENFYEAVARYKQYDLLVVNSIFDGMNLVAKEAPGGQPARRRRDALREHRLPRGDRRGHAQRQPVRHPGAGRRDPPRADHGSRGARAARRTACARSSTVATPATGSTTRSPTSGSSRRRTGGDEQTWRDRPFADRDRGFAVTRAAWRPGTAAARPPDESARGPQRLPRRG